MQNDPLRLGQQQVRIEGRDENKDLVVGARMKSSFMDGLFTHWFRSVSRKKWFKIPSRLGQIPR